MVESAPLREDPRVHSLSAYTATMRAREILRDVTPLVGDCGRLCGSICCDSPDPTAGMLLYPGEETLYTGYDIIPPMGFPEERWLLWRCRKPCDRTERPLACRVAPLVPIIRDGVVGVEMDRRCGWCCPLVDYGMKALRRDFVNAVQEAAVILSEDPTCRDFLIKMTAHMDIVARMLLSAIIAPERDPPS